MRIPKIYLLNMILVLVAIATWTWFLVSSRTAKNAGTEQLMFALPKDSYTFELSSVHESGEEKPILLGSQEGAPVTPKLLSKIEGFTAIISGLMQSPAMPPSGDRRKVGVLKAKGKASTQELPILLTSFENGERGVALAFQGKFYQIDPHSAQELFKVMGLDPHLFQ